MSELRTVRLRLRPLTSEDAASVHALWTMPAVASFIWDGRAVPIEHTIEILLRNEELFAQSHFGLWGAWREDDRLVALTGLWHFRDPPELELIYAVADDTCGLGYATEAAAAVVEYAVREVGMNVIRASVDAPNEASARVLAKLGFRFSRRATVGGLDTLFYERIG